MKLATKAFCLSGVVLATVLAGGCCENMKGHGSANGAMTQPDWTAMTQAVAVIYPTEGNQVHGVVHFKQTSDGVEVMADISGLAPNSDHGFHIHEFGDASDPKGMGAGGHFNPTHMEHGGPHAEHHHAGDLGNVHADADGHATISLTVPGITIDGPTGAILGRSVVIHRDPDDLKSQPAGNSGPRIGVGVIGAGAPPK